MRVISRWGLSLYHISDLPFKVQDLPHIYGKFRERTREIKVRQPFDAPKKNELPFLKDLNREFKMYIEYEPKLEDFGFDQKIIETPLDERSCL